MNKQSISKVNLFLIGLKSRLEENLDIFKNITVVYKTGLKNFKGIGTYDSDKIKFNFNGKTESLSMDGLTTKLCDTAVNYDSMILTYSERGTDILIEADNKNVKMKNIDIKEEETISNSINETSTLLNRNYYIKVGKADKLLKEIGVMTKEGKVKNYKIRKYNQIDHYVELFDEMLNDIPRNKVINILDCGCGKSYLSFVLNYYLTEVKKIKCHFIGLDYKESVIETSRKMAENLGYKNMEFHEIDVKDYIPKNKIGIVMSLHACDTATDMALALGIKLDSDAIIAVPCCHRELLSQYSYEPFKSILKHGVFKSRMADILTDGMRSLLLEAKGYDVSVVEYISPLETPKNIMIRALKNKDENEDLMAEYFNLMSSLNVYPALYGFLNE
ncbi:SAM-dependent methyltransferase [Clostridiaceae bacterium UIB06]|uniref:SAM-dependent methyltransferase n=1 Tax=Clostridium thailandense TaxID=2794346 RepID=A0A949X631_9CLOT|nr:SAM-dependent methyltransferase [Clostridium thailandense]MBV7276663.1 SAM-dependent methyltransferase [Clostridium thailandense]MCH5138442.1 SAM-dependent methyltransferase [Clostridiaceae bacterium UIB06]